MDKMIGDKVRVAMIEHTTAMINENFKQISEDFDIANADFIDRTSGMENPAKFKFNVGLGCEMKPIGKTVAVFAKISWSVPRKDSSDPEIIDGMPQLKGTSREEIDAAAEGGA